jgi:arylsulfatase A-like enzyme
VPGERRPNIIVVVFDALGANALQQYQSLLPALSSLRRDSVVFENAYTPAPQAAPARASFFTGLDPSVHGVWTDGVPLPDREQTFSQRLALAGYSTWLVGRRQLSGLSHWTTEPLRAGEYEQCEWAHGPLHRSRQNAYLQWLQKEAPDNYTAVFPVQPNPDDTRIAAAQSDGVNGLSDELSFNHWVGDRIGQMIAAHESDRPFLGIAGFVVGDTLGAEPPMNGETLNINAAVQADHAVRHIVDCVQQAGYADNTVVIVCASSGNSADAAQPMSEKRVRVPLSVFMPAVDAAVRTKAVSTIDIAATVCDIAQLQSPQRVQGVSLLADDAGDDDQSDWVLSRQRCERGGWYTALRFNEWKLVVTHQRMEHEHRAQEHRAQEHRAQEHRANESSQSQAEPVYQLYNLATDPNEETNLAANADYETRLEAMIDTMIDARCAMEDRTEPRIAKF